MYLYASVDKFIVQAWEIYVDDSGIGLSHRPASLCSLAGLYDNPLLKSTSTLFPQSGALNLANKLLYIRCIFIRKICEMDFLDIVLCLLFSKLVTC